MRKRRIMGYVIDLCIIAVILGIIYVIIPRNNSVKVIEQNNLQLQQSFFDGEITFYEYTKKYTNNLYEIKTNEKIQSYIYLITLIVYFVLLPYFWHGRTIGSYLCKLQIENFVDGEAKWYQYLIRSFLINGLGYVLLSIIFVHLLSGTTYFIGVSVLTFIQLLILAINAVWIMIKKESRGIHGVISGTEIVKIITPKRRE